MQSKEICLRAPRQGDLDAFLEWRNDFDLAVQLSAVPQPWSRERVEGWLTSANATPDQALLVIANATDLEPLGCVRLMFVDWVSRVCELGIYIGSPGFRGAGIGTQALDLTMDYAFRVLNLSRMHLKVRSDNKAAIRLYEGAGFIREGVLREHTWNGGATADMFVYGLLRSEWSEA